jgi:hypothetical protein
MRRSTKIIAIVISSMIGALLLNCGDDNATKFTITKNSVIGIWSTHAGVPAPGGKGSFWAYMTFQDASFLIAIIYQHKPDTGVRDSVHIETGTWTFGADSIRMVRELCRQKDTNTQEINVIPCGATNAALPVPQAANSWDIPLSAVAVYLQTFLQGIDLPEGTITLFKDK